MSKTVAERSGWSKVLEIAMKSVPVGGLISYAEIDKATGVTGFHRKHNSVIHGVLRLLLASSGIVFSCVPKQGYRRTDEAGKVDVIRQRSKRASKDIRRGLKVGAHVVAEELSPNGRDAFFVLYAQLRFGDHSLKLTPKRLAPVLDPAQLMPPKDVRALMARALTTKKK